ncbi:RHS repeat-associated core domain-containing protein [Tumidithrix elongata RA019]|uniref:RHS repeat-associated core domain-containing protein n=1 Tax=Tumidithrix elongata BACA0141 TaxID=2716417 RepID=A0AAW9Q4H3_9CYAN|nr:RHS repeat-associated core domain-containing protein [Tumidithrix elongata RA019]
MSGINRFASTDQSVPVVNSNLTFDLASKLTALTHVRNATTINSNGLTYDAAARVTQLMTVDGSSGYGYDATSQLTAATHSYQTSEVFSYDALGNRTGYVTTANNRLQSDGTFTYLYDDEGNRTQRTRISTGEVTSYTWDYRNRLTGVDTKNNSGILIRSVSYKYDIFDRRIAKTVDLDGAGAGAAVTERYVYDRDHIMLVFVGSTLKERYLYGANLDQVLAVETTQVSWTLSDYLGTVRDLVSSAGVVQNHIKYDSFGNITGQSAPTMKSRFGFTGREFDSETGLYYYRSRYYDPVVGRFICEDRISFAGGDTNLYRYVGNSATNGTDPWGFTAGSKNDPNIGDLIWAAIVGLVGAAASGLGGLFQGNPPAPAPAPTTTSTTSPSPIPSASPTPSFTPRPLPTKIPLPDPVTGGLNSLGDALSGGAKKYIECQDQGKEKMTCKDAYPNLIPCTDLPGQYSWPDANFAANVLAPNGYRENAVIADKGPCGQSPAENPKRYTLGYHYNVKKRNGNQAGSVGQCECCEENGGDPKPSKRGAILRSQAKR